MVKSYRRQTFHGTFLQFETNQPSETSCSDETTSFELVPMGTSAQYSVSSHVNYFFALLSFLNYLPVWWMYSVSMFWFPLLQKAAYNTVNVYTMYQMVLCSPPLFHIFWLLFSEVKIPFCMIFFSFFLVPRRWMSIISFKIPTCYGCSCSRTRRWWRRCWTLWRCTQIFGPVWMQR